MIRFFRRIRQNLVSENKFTKYLLYAMGEIVLVVIGILLALQINNWNDNRKSRLKINQILTKVREELALNINSANEVTSYYRAKEKNLGRVLGKEVTIEDYKSTSLVYLIWNSNTSDISDDAAKELDGFAELLNDEELELVSRVDKLYGDFKPTIDVMDKEIEQAVIDFDLRLKTTKNWYYLSNDPKKLPESAFNYFLNDTLYLNDVAYYESNGLENHFIYNTFFSDAAKKLYIDLCQYLNAKIDSELIKPIDSFKDIYGTYALKASIKQDTMIISRQGQRIVYRWIDENGSDTYSLFPESEDKFVIGYRFAELIRDKDNKVIGLMSTLGSTPQKEYEKVK